MVIVVVLLVLLAALAPLMAGQVITDAPLLNASTSSHAALAAAEAGVQWYRDNLDSYSNYYTYTAANNPTHDPALSGWCGANQPSTCDLSGTSPSEAFHYVPNASSLFSTTGSSAGTVVLAVTGRAGVPGHYAYVYAQASFGASSILDNAYYSNYEVLDPNSQTIQGNDVTASIAGGATTSIPENNYPVSSYTNSAGTTSTVNPAASVWQLACKYDTYSVNTFVDALGLTIGGTKYSSGYPYYGPYFQNSGFSFTIPGPQTTTVTVPALPCESPYDFVNGETFNGPVYTNDQLHVCGSPTFNGSPVSLTSGAPSNVPYLPVTGPGSPRDVPGSVLVTAANSGTKGPYPSSLIGDYVPAGYTTDNLNCGGGGDTPTLAHGVALNGSQSLPSTNSSLQQYGTVSPPAPAIGTGCTYVGPTMIELVTSGGTTTMDVWSPLSINTTTTTSACSGGSTFSAANPLISNIALPSDGVIYVENDIPGSTPPTVPSDGSNPGGANPCFNPYQSAQPANSQQCLEGDVYIEGELHGSLTVASQANIMVTRDLTYSCADGGGGASQTDPSSVTACTTATTPDILGLSAQDDILISGNQRTSSNPLENPQNCTSNGFGDGTGSPVNQKSGGFGGTVINGTYYPNDPAAVWPTVCNPQNVIVDAAVFGVQGSFGVENWNTTPQSGNAYLNGADLSQYRGPFGIVGQDGYQKEFSFDQRLAFLSPPNLIPAGVPLWQEDTYVLCPNTSCPAVH